MAMPRTVKRESRASCTVSSTWNVALGTTDGRSRGRRLAPARLRGVGGLRDTTARTQSPKQGSWGYLEEVRRPGYRRCRALHVARSVGGLSCAPETGTDMSMYDIAKVVGYCTNDHAESMAKNEFAPGLQCCREYWKPRTVQRQR